MICPNCGKETIGRYATDNDLCGECSSDTDKLSDEKLQEQLDTAKKALTEIASSRQEIYRGGTLVGLELTEDAKIAFEALAAIGGNK
ncbi:Phage protein [Lactococcus cremoris]|nr:Phage protein [Lactococcus cremoris]